LKKGCFYFNSMMVRLEAVVDSIKNSLFSRLLNCNINKNSLPGVVNLQ